MIFYDTTEDEETLTNDCPHEEVAEYLDARDPKDWPRVLHVLAFDHKEITDKDRARMADWILEDLLEKLSDEYGDPDGGDDPTAAMGAAAKTFVDVVCREFPVWQCERVPHLDEHVPVAQWVRENETGWITDSEDVRAWLEAQDTRAADGE